MLRDDRRMQEGSRDLAIAFNIGRAEEALHRLDTGNHLDAQDASHFERIADLFFEALDGYRWIEASIQGTGQSREPNSLKAFQLVIPVIREEVGGQTVIKFVEDLAKTAQTIGSGKGVDSADKTRFGSILRRLGSLAARQGVDALEKKAPSVAFAGLAKSAP